MTKENIKQVRFDFYQVYVHQSNKRYKDDKLFDLDDIWEIINEISELKDKSIDYNGDIVRCDNIYVNNPDKNPLTVFHFTKLRSDNVPATTSLQLPKLSEVNLKDDEYIAEDVSGLYDHTNHVIMLQKNIFSLSMQAIANYLTYFWQKSDLNREDQIIEFRPVMRKDAFKQAKKAKNIKKLIVKTANLGKDKMFPKNLLSSSLNNIISAMEQYGGSVVEVKITPRRSKDSFLDKDKVQETIKEIEENPKLFTKAVIVDKDQQQDTIELLAGKIHIYREFNVPTKTYLNPETVQEDIIGYYSLNYDTKFKQTIDNNLLIK